MDSIGNIIRNYRNEKEMSGASLAEKIGISASAISHIETGRRKPSREILEKIVNVLEIPIEAFADNNIYNDISRNKVITGVLLKTKIGVTDISFEITTSISEDIDMDSLTEEERKQTKGKYLFETPVIVNSITDFLDSNKDELRKLIIDNLNHELDKMRKNYY